ncbi:Poly [ADP-ribose] polymerase [Aphelenchoides besseyi]|nr:Poly [ADP-ribose] polymerase [Aphelenchoides besseyi]
MVGADPRDPRIKALLDDLEANDTHRNAVARSLLPVDDPMITMYVNNTQGKTHDFKLRVVEAFEIERPGDREFKNGLANHKLLWHGTQPEHSEAMLGAGIYFTNCATKAANYSSSNPNKYQGGADEGTTPPGFRHYGYLFLSEVALGRINEYTDANKQAKRDLRDGNSSYIRGTHRPAGEYTIQNVSPPIKVPAAPLVEYNKEKLLYDEYVVYYSNQIRHKYLVKVEILPKYLHKQANDPGFSIVARQHKGIVFLNEFELGEPNRLSSGSEKQDSIKAYIWDKLEQILTLADGDKWPDYKAPANLGHQLKVVSRCDLIDEDGPGVHRLLLAGNAKGNYVRILPFQSKSTPKSAKLLASCHMSPQSQMRNYIESILCDIKNVVAGVYTQKEKHCTLRQVLTMQSDLFLSEAKDWNINDCLDYVFQFINRVNSFSLILSSSLKVRVTLHVVPEGTIIHIVRPPKSLEYKLTLVEEDKREEMNMLSEDFLDVVRLSDLMSG